MHQFFQLRGDNLRSCISINFTKALKIFIILRKTLHCFHNRAVPSAALNKKKKNYFVYVMFLVGISTSKTTRTFIYRTIKILMLYSTPFSKSIFFYRHRLPEKAFSTVSSSGFGLFSRTLYIWLTKPGVLTKKKKGTLKN